MNYWLDLFTGKTWKEFIKNGSKISGFRKHREKVSKKIKPGDYLLCYLTGLSRFIGVLEVTSNYFIDETPIWEDEVFPVRFNVKLIHKLEPGTSVPVLKLKEKLSIFKNLKNSKAWSGFFRGSPALFPKEDGEIIIEAIKYAEKNPEFIEFDEKKLWRKPKIYKTKGKKVTIPKNEKIIEEETEYESTSLEKTTHEEIQYFLLKFGSDMGLSVCAARSDRNKSYNGRNFNEIKNFRNSIPSHFDEATYKTIENIDVLWLQDNVIIAAFEIEHTTSIYSGLLRMSDLISMQPNIKIDLYLVAPDERRQKVIEEINRPTFIKLKPPLPEICKFISYSKLKDKLKKLGISPNFIKSDFINTIAESCLID